MDHYLEVCSVICNSTLSALTSCFPEYHLAQPEPITTQKPTAISHREFFNAIGEKLGAHTAQDWYKVKTAQVMGFPGARTIMNKHGGSLAKSMQFYSIDTDMSSTEGYLPRTRF
jgi:hypothetical protein